MQGRLACLQLNMHSIISLFSSCWCVSLVLLFLSCTLNFFYIPNKVAPVDVVVSEEAPYGLGYKLSGMLCSQV